MRKKIYIILFLLAIICITFILYNNNQSLTYSNDYDKEKEVKQFISQYYENLLNQKYESALSQIYYAKADYVNDLFQIKNKSKDYKITYPLDRKIWVRNVNYDKKEKTYIVEATAQISYKTKNWIASEIIYVKNIDKELKIIKILTDDIYCNLRGSKVVYIGTNK